MKTRSVCKRPENLPKQLAIISRQFHRGNQTEVPALVQGLVLALLVGGCVPAPPPLRTEMTAQEALTAVNPLIDCEWRAAARYDDGKQSVAALANPSPPAQEAYRRAS